MPFEIPRAVALYERDGGLLWKHYDDKLKRNQSRRARQLVLSWIATVGNYEYGFNWVFHQDGTLEMEVLLSGFVETKALPSTENPTKPYADLYSHPLAGNLAGVHHQHFFNFRLDMDADGAANGIFEQNVEPLPTSAANPYGNAFTMHETLLRNEQEAQRLINPFSGRTWRVINPSQENALGQSVGYTLVAGDNSLPMAQPDSWMRKRAGFVNAHVWVTPYDPAQMYAAGSTSTRARVATACQLGLRPVAPSRTAILFSGTPWGSPIFRVRRIGQSCPSTAPVSSSCSAVFLIRTRRSTSPARDRSVHITFRRSDQ